MNEDRLNPTLRANTVEYLQACALMLKKSLFISDQILPKYMFKDDIKEFKNSKIYKYLYSCELYIEGFTHRSRLLLKDHQALDFGQPKRTSHTPDIST